MRLSMFRPLVGAAVMALGTSTLVIACDLGVDYPFGPPGFGGAPAPVFDAGAPREHPDTCDVDEGDSCFGPTADACETKKHANPTCNGSLDCTGSVWKRRPAARSTCASECPAAYGEDQPEACAIPNAGTLICEYFEGTCGCAPVLPVDADAGDAGDAGEDAEDAGESDGGETDAGSLRRYEWRCIKAEAGCPRMRPVIGSDCVRPMTCDYGDCLFEDGIRMRCYSGTWSSEKRCEL